MIYRVFKKLEYKDYILLFLLGFKNGIVVYLLLNLKLIKEKYFYFRMENFKCIYWNIIICMLRMVIYI